MDAPQAGAVIVVVAAIHAAPFAKSTGHVVKSVQHHTLALYPVNSSQSVQVAGDGVAITAARNDDVAVVVLAVIPVIEIRRRSTSHPAIEVQLV